MGTVSHEVTIGVAIRVGQVVILPTRIKGEKIKLAITTPDDLRWVDESIPPAPEQPGPVPQRMPLGNYVARSREAR